MLRSVCPLAPVIPLLLLVSCSHSSLPVTHAASPSGGEPNLKREVRITGIVQAVHSFKVLVPQITGNNNRMSLTHIVPSGTHVETGDPIASFDATTQLDALRDASAKFDDLGHQADQKRAQNRADAEKRATDLLQAEGDLAKATIELRKGPVLGEIARLKNEEKARIARLHVESLKKSMAEHDKSDAAALRILELQRDRQKVAMERAQTNIDKLNVKAPLAGMVAQATVYRGNTQGHPQEGDQLFRGQPLVSIFDPSEMLVRCAVGEPDIASITSGSRATVYLDAYPDIALAAHFEAASPVASAGWDSPIKTFTAVFRVEKSDPHLLPDLSAAVVLEAKAATGGSK